ncbi:hypothetical protein E4U59_001188 [Claviceps monticola]|nr:hypothetical protein E4U59_001188 [Claviceps monticola]
MYPMLNTPLTDLETVLMYQSYWQKRTGWILHFWESNLEHLAHAARLPGKDEPELEVVADAIEDLIEDCVKGLALLPLDLRRWLRSDHSTEMHPRPMGRLTNRCVHYKNANIWKRLICYSPRVAQSEESHEVESPSPFVKKEENDAEIPIMRGDRMDDAYRLFPWRDGQKAQAPMFHAMAILGIYGEKARHKEGHESSFMVVGLLYCSRVIASEILLPSKDREQHGDAEYEAFFTKAEGIYARWLIECVQQLD